MNYLALVNSLQQECGVSGSTLTSFSNLPLEQTRLQTWINNAWVDIQSVRVDWNWMRKPFAFTTTSGKPIYAPVADIGLSDFGWWDRNTFRNYQNPQVTLTIASPCVVTLQGHLLSTGDTVIFQTTGALPTGLVAGTTYYVNVVDANTFNVSATNGGSNINTSGSQSGTQTIWSPSNTTTFVGFKSEIFTSYLTYEWWRDAYEYGALRTVTTRPTQFTITPNMSIGLGPFPGVGYTVVGEYQSTPTSLSLTTDTPTMPSQFHMAIVYRAMMHYGSFESAADVYNRGESEYKLMMRRLQKHQMQEILEAPAL